VKIRIKDVLRSLDMIFMEITLIKNVSIDLLNVNILNAKLHLSKLTQYNTMVNVHMKNSFVSKK